MANKRLAKKLAKQLQKSSTFEVQTIHKKSRGRQLAKQVQKSAPILQPVVEQVTTKMSKRKVPKKYQPKVEKPEKISRKKDRKKSRKKRTTPIEYTPSISNYDIITNNVEDYTPSIEDNDIISDEEYVPEFDVFETLINEIVQGDTITGWTADGSSYISEIKYDEAKELLVELVNNIYAEYLLAETPKEAQDVYSRMIKNEEDISQKLAKINEMHYPEECANSYVDIGVALKGTTLSSREAKIFGSVSDFYDQSWK